MSECCVDCWYALALEESAGGTEVHPRLPLGQINRHSGVASHQIISGVMELLLLESNKMAHLLRRETGRGLQVANEVRASHCHKVELVHTSVATVASD